MSPFTRGVVKWSRTVHLYLTLFCLGLLLFFGVTGLMLNHEDWFLPPVERRTATAPCAVPAALVTDAESNELAIVEHLRAQYGAYVVGSLSTVEDLSAESTAGVKQPLLEVSPDTVRGVFKRPGSEVCVVLYRVQQEVEGQKPEDSRTFQPGEGVITYSTKGMNGLLLDLHRGKDSSGPWHLVIDVVAVAYLVVSATGIIMWLSLKGRGRYGLAAVIGGVALSVLLVVVFELIIVRN